MHQKSRQYVLNNLYNQDIAPEDSEVTSFLYHKTLALESILAILSFSIMLIGLINHIYRHQLGEEKRHNQNIIMIVLTCVSLGALILKRMTMLEWIKEKKETYSKWKEMGYLALECLFFLPCPLEKLDLPLQITTYSSEVVEISLNTIITLYLLFNKYFYILEFLIHSELFYGSRPDRLSRIYTVQFGTFNAIKFLINQKPGLVVITTFSFNFFLLPFAMLIIEGQINESLNNFGSCLHYVAVTQVTVGYGDLNVVSVFGRLVAIITIMAGVTNTSLLLVLFMRLMELNNQEEESYFLLECLERKINLKKARVVRIEKEWKYSNIRCRIEDLDNKRQEIRAFRYNNRRDIMLERSGPVNVKRMMISNFSQINQSLRNIQEKNKIIKKCIDVIRGKEINFMDKINKKTEEFNFGQKNQSLIKQFEQESEQEQEKEKEKEKEKGTQNEAYLLIKRRDRHLNLQIDNQNKQSNNQKIKQAKKEEQSQKEVQLSKNEEKSPGRQQKVEGEAENLQNRGSQPLANTNSIDFRIREVNKLDIKGVSAEINLNSTDEWVVAIDLTLQRDVEKRNEKECKISSPYNNTRSRFQVYYGGEGYQRGPTRILCKDRIYHPSISNDGLVQLPSSAEKEPRMTNIREVAKYLRGLLVEPASISQGGTQADIFQQLKKDYKLFVKIVQHTKQGLEYQNRVFDNIVIPADGQNL